MKVLVFVLLCFACETTLAEVQNTNSLAKNAMAVFTQMRNAASQKLEFDLSSFHPPPLRNDMMLATLLLCHVVLFLFVFWPIIDDLRASTWTCPSTYIAKGFTTHMVAWFVSHSELPPLIEFDGGMRDFFLVPSEPINNRTYPDFEFVSDVAPSIDDEPLFTAFRVKQVTVRHSDFDLDRIRQDDLILTANCEPIKIVDQSVPMSRAAPILDSYYNYLVKKRPFTLQILRPITTSDCKKKDQIFIENAVQMHDNVKSFSRLNFIGSPTALRLIFAAGIVFCIIPFLLIFPPADVPLLHNRFLRVDIYVICILGLIALYFSVEQFLSRKAEKSYQFTKRTMLPLVILMITAVLAMGSMLFNIGRTMDTNTSDLIQLRINLTWTFLGFSLSALYLMFKLMKILAQATGLQGAPIVDPMKAGLLLGLIQAFRAGLDIYESGRDAVANGGTCKVNELAEFVTQLKPLNMEKRVMCDVSFVDSESNQVIPAAMECPIMCGNTQKISMCYVHGIQGAVWNVVKNDVLDLCCTPCQPDHFVTTECSDTSDRVCQPCHSCGAGTYVSKFCSGEVTIDDKQCSDCPDGHYQDIPNQHACKPCAVGTLPNEARTACV